MNQTTTKLQPTQATPSRQDESTLGILAIIALTLLLGGLLTAIIAGVVGQRTQPGPYLTAPEPAAALEYRSHDVLTVPAYRVPEPVAIRTLRRDHQPARQTLEHVIAQWGGSVYPTNDERFRHTTYIVPQELASWITALDAAHGPDAYHRLNAPPPPPTPAAVPDTSITVRMHRVLLPRITYRYIFATAGVMVFAGIIASIAVANLEPARSPAGSTRPKGRSAYPR